MPEEVHSLTNRTAGGELPNSCLSGRSSHDSPNQESKISSAWLTRNEKKNIKHWHHALQGQQTIKIDKLSLVTYERNHKMLTRPDSKKSRQIYESTSTDKYKTKRDLFGWQIPKLVRRGWSAELGWLEGADEYGSDSGPGLISRIDGRAGGREPGRGGPVTRATSHIVPLSSSSDGALPLFPLPLIAYFVINLVGSLYRTLRHRSSILNLIKWTRRGEARGGSWYRGCGGEETDWRCCARSLWHSSSLHV